MIKMVFFSPMTHVCITECAFVRILFQTDFQICCALHVKWTEISAIEPHSNKSTSIYVMAWCHQAKNITQDNIDPDLYCLMARCFSLICLISYRVILHHDIWRFVLLFSQCLSQLDLWLVSRRQHLLLDALYIACLFKYFITTKLSKYPLHNTAARNILLILSSQIQFIWDEAVATACN